MNVEVSGIGCSDVGEHWGKSARDLFKIASLQALEDASLKSVDLLIAANMSMPQYTDQNNVGNYLSDDSAPAFRVESACSSGGAALHAGYLAIKSGEYDSVMVAGVEKMTDRTTEINTHILAGASDFEREAFYGASFPALNALLARRYMHEYGATETDLLMFSVNAHKNAVGVEHAFFQKETTLEACLKSPYVASPLRLMDCSPTCDGSAVVILTKEGLVKRDERIILEGSAISSDKLELARRPEPTFLSAGKASFEKAAAKANITAGGIDVYEIHDAFSIMAALDLECIGAAKKGEGYRLAKEGQIAIDGDYPIATSGGLKARGHPVGATGVYQAYDAMLQLRGKAAHQVKDAETAMTHNIGGSGSMIAANIFRRSK